MDGAQLILHARPAALLAIEEGRRVWRALGALGQKADAALASVGATDPTSVDRFTFSIAPGEAFGVLETSLALEAVQNEAPPLLSREFESLLATSDTEHLATLIVSPDFLLSMGGVLVGDSDSAVRKFLLDSCEEDWRAVALAVHLSQEHLYWEVRVHGDSSTPELARARELQKRFAESPDDAAELVRGRNWSAYAEPVVAKSPAMLAAFSRNARRGVDGRQAVVNGYLPAKAAHNLALMADLLVAELSGAPPAEAAEEAAPKSLVEQMRTPVTAVFEREPLESALTVVANSMGATFEILGRDLQLEGITRNQMLSLDLRDQPAQKVLVELLRKANPDTLATGPADPRQKLVYVVRGERVVITTRAAAERRGESLPDVFQP